MRAGPGRPKGSQNKSTRSVKEALMIAFTELGGAGGLARWAKDNPTPFYQLWGKLLPLQVVGDPDNPVQVVSRIELVDLSALPAQPETIDVEMPVVEALPEDGSDLV